MSDFEKFKSLHHQPEPLLLGNAWNVSSARVMEEKGIRAIASSSSAIADTLGYADGENISFAELLHIVSRIAQSVNVPVSADIETGYSDSIPGLLSNIDQLIAAGIVGINLEDSSASANRTLLPAEDFVKKLAAIRAHLAATKQQLFINARTDTFLLNVPDRLEETFKRARLYEDAGADSLFVPFIQSAEDIRQVVTATQLPLNVLSMKGLPSFTELGKLGVKRISMGGSLFWNMKKTLGERLEEVFADDGFTSLF